ncbi:MAG TPA: hypothetical protein VF937_09540 [Chloroflexota bacterium]
MSVIAPASTLGRADRGVRVSFTRLAWVAPLTFGAALAAALGVRALAQALDPSLSNMAQLHEPLIALTVEGALAAIVVFVLFGLFVPRAIFWYRVFGVVALVLSWAPDIALGLGGSPMRTAMRYVGPLTGIPLPGLSGPSGPPPGGPPPGARTGGPPPGFLSGLPVEQVLVLMLLHGVVAVVCVGLLTTLASSQRGSATRPSRSA